MLLFDGGSNDFFITHSAAKQLKAKKHGNTILYVTTMNDIKKEYRTITYEICLILPDGRLFPFVAY